MSGKRLITLERKEVENVVKVDKVDNDIKKPQAREASDVDNMIDDDANVGDIPGRPSRGRQHDNPSSDHVNDDVDDVDDINTQFSMAGKANLAEYAEVDA